ncbi:MAG: FAD-dependent oxidoreductase [Kofleriaceae bacterium]
MNITVVGAGIIGLTTALTLEERGHSVRVIASAIGSRTTSAVAGAIWFPYRVGPKDKVSRWAAHTRGWLEGHAGDPSSGIDVLTGYEITSEPGVDPEPPWWGAHIDLARSAAPVTGAPLAWSFRAPRAEPSLFMPWVTARLNAPIETRAVTDLADEAGDVVVNCTGLGARDIVDDRELVGLFGQIVLTDPGAVDRSITVTDDRDPDEVFYMIPRRDELVLGGCSIPWRRGAPVTIDPAITDRILAHARRLGLSVGAVRAVRTGLRPFRNEVRLQREGRIIHNYGHGGAGFTLCRGCAEEVAQLVERS